MTRRGGRPPLLKHAKYNNFEFKLIMHLDMYLYNIQSWFTEHDTNIKQLRIFL